MKITPDEIREIFPLRSMYEQAFFRNFFTQDESAEGLNHSQIITVIILKIEGPLRMSTISEKLNLEKGSFTPVAKRLIELGYIERTRDEQDKRVFNLSLTEEGLVFAEKLKEKHVAYIENLLNIFDQYERERFFKAVSELNVLIGKLL